MRNALPIFVATLILSGFFVAGAWAADAVPDAAFTGPTANTSSSPLEDDRGLLPIRGSSLPMSGSMDGSGTPRDTPQASVIEAIPTPTAFHTGALLISAIIAGRFYRKARTRFAAAA